VKDDRGEPVSGAVVRAWPSGGTDPVDWVETTTDARGGFRLPRVREGELRIAVRASNGATGAATVAAQASRSTSVPISVIRDPTAAGREEADCRASLSGARLLRPCGEEEAAKHGGWVVVGVDGSSDAEAAGLLPGDGIVAIDGRARDGREDIERAAPGRPGESVIVEIARGGARTHVLLARGAGR
jgi:membrane-associated protease RseP (regulator of RpoE activity)